MTDRLSPLEQSLLDDIASEQSEINKEPDKAPEQIAEEVKEQIEKPEQEQESEQQSAEEITQEEDEEIPANPTNNDYAKLRIKLKAEADARKKAEAEAQRIREEAARKDGYIAAKNEATPKQQVAQEVQDPEPNYDDDPKAWIQWNNRQHQREIDALKKDNQQNAIKQNLQNMITTATNEEVEYSKSNPEYGDAKAYLKNLVYDNMRKQNPLKSDAEIDLLVKQEEYAAIVTAKMQGLSPAIYFEALAKQAGYKSNGKQQANASTEPKINMDAIKRNKEKAPSLVGTRTNAGGMGEPTDDEIADLTLSQLAALKK